MPLNPSLLSVLMRANAANEAQTIVDVILSIQTQLSEIQENQRKIMKQLRDLKIEQKSRLSDLKKSTLILLKDSHSELSDKLNEIQDSVDEQMVGDDLDEGEYSLDDLFK
ncbi:MAG: hypothetical protein II767_04030 [Proteobacteria bacterium]|nr:hypothetical protein [Pseudomonadota bacterium]